MPNDRSPITNADVEREAAAIRREWLDLADRADADADILDIAAILFESAGDSVSITSVSAGMGQLLARGASTIHELVDVVCRLGKRSARDVAFDGHFEPAAHEVTDHGNPVTSKEQDAAEAALLDLVFVRSSLQVDHCEQAAAGLDHVLGEATDTLEKYVCARWNTMPEFITTEGTPREHQHEKL